MTIMPSAKVATGRSPTHAQLIDFFNNTIPSHPQDIPLQYHVPRWPHYDPATVFVRDIVLSITPTPGVYDKLSHLARGRQKAVCFLHRPFQLDRRSLPRGSLVLANHKRFDELLTTGYNTALATRLGVQVDQSFCIQGYKGDPDRRIGIVGPLGVARPLEALASMIEAEVGMAELYPGSRSPVEEVRAVAIMNAFGPDEVARVVAGAEEYGLAQAGDASGLLYLTGQPRDLGLEAAKVANTPVICVGHRPAEEWGIRYLAHLLRELWPRLAVHIVLEDESLSADKSKPDNIAGAIDVGTTPG
jgi:putative NIF3 family GTP cyclohydrolase 1 type 2